ncbi:tRNA (cytidine(34)-2'-O)-methyltransferase [Chitinophagales bacterium]|jgi:tRNA (cytidine/uridine-2'-O-)-methyltransferase|nr:tRNA (cytidine(34)-2'-O)-methyltransferase [Chitinophagales bacterium]
MPFDIVLIEPEIPNNTGNIGRLCLAVGAKLHLVKPFGFELTDKRLKRAGLDYWPHLDVQIYESQEEFFEINQGRKMFFLSSHGKQEFWDIPFEEDVMLIFGKESVGLDKDLLKRNSDLSFRIPLASEKVRSMNLANAVAVVAFEGARQLRS